VVAAATTRRRESVVRIAAVAATVAGLNVALAAAIALGRPEVAIALGLVPALAIAAGSLAASDRTILVFIAFFLGVYGDPLTERVPISMGVNIWGADLLVASAALGWALGWAISTPGNRPGLPRAPLLGLAFGAFALAIAYGAWHGHLRFDEPLVGMPLRLIVYAGIAGAMGALTPQTTLRGLTLVFYGGAAFQFFNALLHIGTGTSESDYLSLSTGGIRYLGISTGIFMTGALLLALLNLLLTERRLLLHAAAFACALFTVVVSYSRSVYVSLAVVLAFLLIAFPRLRSSAVQALPLAIPLVVLAALLSSRIAPDLLDTLVARVVGPLQTDQAVQWREQAVDAVLAWATTEPWLGMGFGWRTTVYFDNAAFLIDGGDPHNSYIYIFTGAGIAAVAALLFLMAAYLVDSVRRYGRAGRDARLVITWSVGFWSIFMIHALTEPVLVQPTEILSIAILMLLPAAVTSHPAPSRIESVRRSSG
jgi:O-antigen ligase